MRKFARHCVKAITIFAAAKKSMRKSKKNGMTGIAPDALQQAKIIPRLSLFIFA
jgi:hypothetical protein